MQAEKIKTKRILYIILVTGIWINLSEILRYFLLVKPMMQEYWKDAHQDIAAMDLGIFAIWGLWDTLLTVGLVYIVWMYTQIHGKSLRSILVSSTIVWAMVFVIFWVATANMGLSRWDILLITLPLSWIEMAIGGLISVKLFESSDS